MSCQDLQQLLPRIPGGVHLGFSCPAPAQVGLLQGKGEKGEGSAALVPAAPLLALPSLLKGTQRASGGGWVKKICSMGLSHCPRGTGARLWHRLPQWMLSPGGSGAAGQASSSAPSSSAQSVLPFAEVSTPQPPPLPSSSAVRIRPPGSASSFLLPARASLGWGLGGVGGGGEGRRGEVPAALP